MRGLTRFLVVVSLAALTAGAARADALRLEAEAMIDFYNAGGTMIRETSCSSASRGRAIDGIDAPGDWIELEFTLSQATAFIDSVRSAGTVGLRRTFAVDYFTEEGYPAAIGDTLTTPPGSGFS